MKFTLTIELGNAAMQTPADVAAALVGVAYKQLAGTLWTDADSGPIRDKNGNTVGRWEVEQA